MAKIKICGITNLEDALLTAELHADAIGFNFYVKSKRFVPPTVARNIIERLAYPIDKFGVFVNETVAKILEIEKLTAIDVIQLHGNEPPEFVTELRDKSRAQVVKTFRIADGSDLSMIMKYEVDAVLLDAYSENEFGGTGKKFDWSVASLAVASGIPVYLAGGLDPENVALAISSVGPFGVDVASGVESSPGKKDHQKLEAFIRNAQNA